jgi:hypothetical protein
MVVGSARACVKEKTRVTSRCRTRLVRVGGDDVDPIYGSKKKKSDLI